MKRRSKLLKKIDLMGKGLEIGPLCWPVVAKSESNIQYVDHVSTEEIKALYKNDENVPSDQIVEVDFPLHGRTLRQAVDNRKFDYIIASHVIEHVPDMVTWLKDMASCLKPSGVLSLAIPDKRYTFDIDRDDSRPADIVGAYLDKRSKPAPGMVFDYMANYRLKVDPKQVWNGQLYNTEGAGPHRYSLSDALSYSLKNRDTNEYIDTHCHVFTPSSFINILKTLVNLRLLDFRVASFYETRNGEYEFFVSLEKVGGQGALGRQLSSFPSVKHPPSWRELKSQYDDQQQIIHLLEAEIKNVLSSKSWQATKPLRLIIKTSRRAKKYLSSLPSR